MFGCVYSQRTCFAIWWSMRNVKKQFYTYICALHTWSESNDMTSTGGYFHPKYWSWDAKQDIYIRGESGQFFYLGSGFGLFDFFSGQQILVSGLLRVRQFGSQKTNLGLRKYFYRLAWVLQNIAQVVSGWPKHTRSA